MSFYLFFLSGVLGGVLGGMGMGGGTLLIPVLTLLFHVPQAISQGVNLLSFLPMSVIALKEHAKCGRVKFKGLLPITLSALLFSGAFAFAAGALPSAILRRGFGFFLIILSIFPFHKALHPDLKQKNLA